MYFAVLAVILVLRHVSKTKYLWYAYELGIGLLLVVGIAAIRPDRLIATIYPPTVNGQVDYVHISRLSVDALPGWLSAVDHARSIARSLPNPSALTEDQTRAIIYASDSLGSLTDRYGDLVVLYGNISDYQALYPAVGPDFTLNRFKSQSARRILLTNFAEKTGYGKLRSQIPIGDLTSLQTILVDYLNQLPAETKAIPLDRSYESPLL